MLKITLLTIGRDKDRWVTEGLRHYQKLVSRWAAVELKAIPSPKQSASLSPDEIKAQEAAAIRRHLPAGRVVALTDTGTGYDSRAFADFIDKLQMESGGRVTFLIGGPYGLSNDLMASADDRLSLSPLTFSHQLVRLVLMEQLYRGFSILHGTDYHK